MENLLLIDFTPSFGTISRTRLLSKLEGFVSDPASDFRTFLIFRFWTPEWNRGKVDIGIPLVHNVLTTVFLSVFIDVFDKEISRRFSFSYARFLNEGVLAFSSQSDCTLFCSTFNLASVLKGMSLSAKVTIIGRGDTQFLVMGRCYP